MGSSGDYEVGYGRPPKETQFQKGMIANPNGSARQEGRRVSGRHQSQRGGVVEKGDRRNAKGHH